MYNIYCIVKMNELIIIINYVIVNYRLSYIVIGILPNYQTLYNYELNMR